mmetsp:Transcript_4408/g.10353  ORF Transcript_4408/g.10353 Transcript_4408/m.10353 type:complete len:227 (-) Transcript_4408:220-900(-)
MHVSAVTSILLCSGLVGARASIASTRQAASSASSALRTYRPARRLRNIVPKAQESIGKVGGTAPTGDFWDPAQFTRDVDPGLVKRYRESELTHGRVSMLGALGFLVQESFHPLFGGDIDGPAINQFQQIQEKYPSFWYSVLLPIAIAEIARARIGFIDPRDGGGIREDYEPGNIGFDPLELLPKTEAGKLSLQNKELNNGRLAMVALAGFMLQELVNGKPILENLE